MIILQSRIDKYHMNHHGNTKELVVRGWLRLCNITKKRVQKGLIFKEFVEVDKIEWEIVTKGVDLRDEKSIGELARDLRDKISRDKNFDLPAKELEFLGSPGLEENIKKIFGNFMGSEFVTYRETPGVVNWFS